MAIALIVLVLCVVALVVPVLLRRKARTLLAAHITKNISVGGSGTAATPGNAQLEEALQRAGLGGVLGHAVEEAIQHAAAAGVKNGQVQQYRENGVTVTLQTSATASATMLSSAALKGMAEAARTGQPMSAETVRNIFASKEVSAAFQQVDADAAASLTGTPMESTAVGQDSSAQASMAASTSGELGVARVLSSYSRPDGTTEISLEVDAIGAAKRKVTAAALPAQELQVGDRVYVLCERNEPTRVTFAPPVDHRRQHSAARRKPARPAGAWTAGSARGCEGQRRGAPRGAAGHNAWSGDVEAGTRGNAGARVALPCGTDPGAVDGGAGDTDRAGGGRTPAAL